MTSRTTHRTLSYSSSTMATPRGRILTPQGMSLRSLAGPCSGFQRHLKTRWFLRAACPTLNGHVTFYCVHLSLMPVGTRCWRSACPIMRRDSTTLPRTFTFLVRPQPLIAWAEVSSLGRSRRAESMIIQTCTPNQRASGKGGIPSLLAIERARPALPEHERWAPLNHDCRNRQSR
jgi:hypothetical protein